MPVCAFTAHTAFAQAHAVIEAAQERAITSILLSTLLSIYGSAQQFAAALTRLLFAHSPHWAATLTAALRARPELERADRLPPQIQMGAFATMTLALELDVFAVTEKLPLALAFEASKVLMANTNLENSIQSCLGYDGARVRRESRLANTDGFLSYTSGFFFGFVPEIRQFLLITQLLATFLSSYYADRTGDRTNDRTNDRSSEVAKLHPAAIKCLNVASGCRSTVVVEACRPLLKLVPTLFENLKMTVFDLDTREDLLNAALQDLRSGRDSNLFLFFQMERTAPYLTAGKERLAAMILTTLNSLSDLLKSVKEVRHNTYQVVLRLYGTLGALPVSTEQMADLVRVTLALTTTLSVRCKSYGAPGEMVAAQATADT